MKEPGVHTGGGLQVLWLERAKPTTGSIIYPQLVELSWKVLETWGSEVLLEKVCQWEWGYL